MAVTADQLLRYPTQEDGQLLAQDMAQDYLTIH